MKITDLEKYRESQKKLSDEELIDAYREDLDEDNGPDIKAIDHFMTSVNEDRLRINNGLTGKHNLLAELRTAVIEGAEELDQIEKSIQ